jgi:hypothetical protein
VERINSVFNIYPGTFPVSLTADSTLEDTAAQPIEVSTA